jgi:8-oxo-dGTP diphosphatase
VNRRFLYRLWRHIPGPLQWTYLWLTTTHYLAGVLALIVDAEGKHVLLLRHDYRRPGEGQWSLPGGQVKGREQLELGLARELREETGLEIEVGPVITVLSACEVSRLDVYYRCCIVGGVLRLDAEIAAAQWFGADDLPADMFPEQVEMIRGVLRET